MFPPMPFEKNPDWANLGDFRQKLPEHPLLFPQSQQDPPLRSRPKLSTLLLPVHCCQSIGLIRSGNHGIFYLVLPSLPALVPFLLYLRG